MREEEGTARCRRPFFRWLSPLERNARPELTASRRDRYRIDLTDVNIGQVAVREVEARMIECVDEVPAQFHVNSLSDIEALRQRHVHHYQLRPVQRRPPRIPESTRCRNRKRCGIKPAVQRSNGCPVGASARRVRAYARHNVRVPRLTALSVALVIRHPHRVGVPALSDERGRDLPATDRFVQRLAVAEIRLAFADWQFVGDVPLERVACVEVRVAVVQARIVPDLPVLWPRRAAPP